MKKLICLLLLSASFSIGTSANAQSPPASDRPISVPAGAALPGWPRCLPFVPEPGLASVRSHDLEVIHAKKPLDGFLVRVAGRAVAFGLESMTIGYMAHTDLQWLDSARQATTNQNLIGGPNEIQVACECLDVDGGTWQIKRRFRPGSVDGAISVETEISVDRDRDIVFLPMLLVFPGAGAAGGEKGQGLFAGLEYLENEPSSSQADVLGPASRRQVPDTLKITFPLMVIQGGDRYVALTWQMRPFLSALFDSPDRLFQSGGHVMGILFPGSNGQNREEGNLLPRTAERVRAGQTLILRATILGGKGSTVVPALKQYCSLRPLPDLPGAPELSAYVSQAAGGWLDSKIRETNLVRHAIAGGSFKPQPAADAALWMEWLAEKTTAPPESTRLRQAAAGLLSSVQADSLNSAGVGHIRYPAEALLFGHVAENADHAEQAGKALLSRFEPDGSVQYHPGQGGLDYAKTHWTNVASGLASRLVLDLLEAAAFSGDRALLPAAISRLQALDSFHNGVPRGAQTWECPLHTPDILASAQMTRAYTLGYELSGDAHFLEEARYWAWTGLPFVYLVNPTDHPIGLYSTIAVFGATQWKAPVWLGLPVQWCGLVYADALYRLVRHDPKGPWKRIADGIAISGMQQSWSRNDPQVQGLLPDSFALRDQKRNGPAINPATLAACAAQYFDPVPVYDFHCFRAIPLLVHAPGEILDCEESTNRVGFKVHGWPTHPYYVLINGTSRRPQIRINGRPVPCSPPHECFEKTGRLILQLQGTAAVELEF